MTTTTKKTTTAATTLDLRGFDPERWRTPSRGTETWFARVTLVLMGRCINCQPTHQAFSSCQQRSRLENKLRKLDTPQNQWRGICNPIEHPERQHHCTGPPSMPARPTCQPAPLAPSSEGLPRQTIRLSCSCLAYGTTLSWAIRATAPTDESKS
jgi:hypothetical protein